MTEASQRVEAEEVGQVALALARDAVERYVRTGVAPAPPCDLPADLREPGGAFVTLRLDRHLRGCIGTLTSTRPDRAQEIIASAISAATRDYRFPPIGSGELPALAYEVDLVEPLEATRGVEDLDARIYGVLVEGERGRGVLLPDLDGVDSVEQQVALARLKAGLQTDEPIRLFRFRVRRFVEHL